MGISINSMGLYGMNAYPVQVEADTLRALPSFDIVGLPDASSQRKPRPCPHRDEKLRI